MRSPSVEIWPETLPPSYQVLPAKIPEIDGLLCLLTDRIDRPLIEAGHRLKVISLMAVGWLAAPLNPCKKV